MPTILMNDYKNYMNQEDKIMLRKISGIKRGKALYVRKRYNGDNIINDVI
jgi:hypothetical protein